MLSTPAPDPVLQANPDSGSIVFRGSVELAASMHVYGSVDVRFDQTFSLVVRNLADYENALNAIRAYNPRPTRQRYFLSWSEIGVVANMACDLLSHLVHRVEDGEFGPKTTEMRAYLLGRVHMLQDINSLWANVSGNPAILKYPLAHVPEVPNDNAPPADRVQPW